MQATKNNSQLTEKYFYNLVQTWNHMKKKKQQQKVEDRMENIETGHRRREV